MDINKYIQMATDMRDADSKRDDLFDDIDDMWHGKFTLPPELGVKPDLRNIIDLSPHDALKSGTAILANSLPHWGVQPLLPNSEEQRRADNIGYCIDYLYRRMNKRGGSTLLWDMVHSCLRYDSVAVWLDYLPYQVGGKPSLRQKHALRGGDYVATVHNPKTVHIQSDDYGINKVLLCTNLTAQEVALRWGDRAKDLMLRLMADEDTGTTRFLYNDLMLYEGDEIKRIVWGSITASSSIDTATPEFIIMNDTVEKPFMPWVVRQGGSTLDIEPEYSIHPLLGPLALSHKWKDLCIFQSVMQSEIIKYGRAPRVKTITPNGEGVSIDYEDGSTLNLTKSQDAERWEPAQIDPNLKDLVDRVRAEVSSATLPRILQNPEFAGNTPFASINAMIQTALGGLNPSKRLCENAHEELALKMIEWAQSEGKPLVSYKAGKKVITEGQDVGTMIMVPPDQLNPESIIITCKLYADAPTDFASRLNAAILQNQQLKVPRGELLEELGRTNPDALYEEWVQEQMDDNEVQTYILISRQRELAKLQAEVQQQMQQAQQQAQQQTQQQTQTGGYPSNTQGLEGLMPTGQGFNPNMVEPNMPQGQTNPPQLNQVGKPGVSSREMVLGRDVTGEPIA